MGSANLHAIPCEAYGEPHPERPPVVFAHANGYPPRAYHQLLTRLAQHFQILAMHNRALWPGSDPQAIQDWQPFTEDLAAFLDQRSLQGILAVGHSIGAITILRLALQQPLRFSAIVLIDPVLFPPWMCLAWDLIYRLGLGYQISPLTAGTLKRRRTFSDRTAMYKNYRLKPVFQRLSDSALEDYVNALARPRTDGQVELTYSPEWEARIYVTGVRRDFDLWRQLPDLHPALLVIRGAETNTFWESTARLLQHRLPSARVVSLPVATHLVPLERPAQVADLIQEFFLSSVQGVTQSPEINSRKG